MALYSIWVVEFASIQQFPESLMISGTLGPATRRLPYTYVVIQGIARTILVDVGFDYRDYAKALVGTMGLNDWQPPKVALGAVGISPEQVTDIVITHAHFDHMGGMDFFPNCTFYIQERELTKWVWALSLEAKFQKVHFLINPADILRAVELATQGRLKLIQGDAENFFPSIDLRLARDTHTWGSMYVTVRNDGLANSRDSWVLAGDLIYTLDNLGLTESSGGVYSTIASAIGGQWALLEATDAMVRSAGDDPHRVIPAHEDRLGQRFPSRIGTTGLRVTEIALADNTPSKVA